jgi:glycosyltransferase involved in cell wall biosynthesis
MDFTIVTPSFRQLDWLELCIASVADQQGVGVEHIVQDAGTAGFDQFAKKMTRFWPERPGYRRVMISEKDAGMYDAVNRGLAKGTSPLCAYLNCDEQYLPGALAKIHKAFEQEPSADVLFAGVLIVKPDGKLIAARMPVRLSLPHVMTCHLANFTCAMFFRRAMLEKQDAWFDAKWRDCADALWVIDRLAKKTNIGRVSEYSTTFTDTGTNMNLSPNAFREAAEIRNRAPQLWRWTKVFWAWHHWMGKLFDGVYWPKTVNYSLHTLEAPQGRAFFSEQRATPFWVGRWFIRERMRFKKQNAATK